MNPYLWVVSLGLFIYGRDGCQRFARTFPLQGASLCVGDIVNYTCTINDTSLTNVITTWTVTQQCTPLLLAQRSAAGPSLTGMATCGNLTARTTDITGTCYTSVLTIVSPRYANGSSVICSAVGNETLKVLLACPPSPPTITPVSCTSSSLTINWTYPFDCGSPIAQYTLTTNPPSQNCNATCTQSPDLRQATLAIQPNKNTTVTLRADNCRGTQAGQTSSSWYQIQTIGSVTDLSGIPLFDVGSQYAATIRFSWLPLSMQLLPAGIMCGLFLSYTLTVAEPPNSTYSFPVQCVPPMCHYELPVQRDAPTLFNCSLKNSTEVIEISSVNDVMNVSVAGTAIICTFLSGLVGTSGCVVSFGTSPDQLLYTITSSQNGGSGQSVTIPLTINGAPLSPSTKYYYEVHLSSDGHHGVIVRGSLVTADHSTIATTTAIKSDGQTAAVAIGVGVGGGVVSVVVVLAVIALIVASKPCGHKDGSSLTGKSHREEDPKPHVTSSPPQIKADFDIEVELHSRDHKSSPHSDTAKATERLPVDKPKPRVSIGKKATNSLTTAMYADVIPHK